MREDPAWEEYLTTGEDPTGGLLEEADNMESYCPQPKQPRRTPNRNGNNGVGIVHFILLIILIALSAGAEKSRNDKKKAEEEKARQELYQQQERERRWEMDHEYLLYKEKEAQAKRELFEQFQEEVRQRSEAINKAKKQQKQTSSGSPYERGYHDGYECGYDDGDCNEGYGYSFLDEATLRRYGEDYRRGFESGYKAGFSAGREDYEYSAGI